MYSALFKNHVDCKFVEDSGSCVFYKNKSGKAKKVVVYEEDSGVDVKDVAISEEEE